MKNNPPIIGQPCDGLFRNIVQLLADRDFKLLQLEVQACRVRQAKEARANRITGMIRRLRRL
jgi:hypothetical protein